LEFSNPTWRTWSHGVKHVERKDKSDWVSACRVLLVEGTKRMGRGRKMWNA